MTSSSRTFAGHLAVVLHAHLPFVRHPEHPAFLEENWFFEAVTETYLPLLQIMEKWRQDQMDVQLTLTLSPTLCAMLQDPLLQERCLRYLDGLIELAEKETFRTHWQAELNAAAVFYLTRCQNLRQAFLAEERDLVAAFRRLQDWGGLEVITCAATHALLPMLQTHPSCLRAQIFVARDEYVRCFGREPRGFWLPECAYAEGIEVPLREAGIRWFLLEAHGLLQAEPRPRYNVFAPIFTPNGLAVFGRDLDSAKQVWSRHEGYPGDPRYRDFYRDIGFDLDLEYVRACLPAAPQRSFTGIKYYAITGSSEEKRIYDRPAALDAAAQHAQHFLEARWRQIEHLAGVMGRAPIVVCPYDAELFGHWWYEGPEFLDYFARKTFFDQRVFSLTSPSRFLLDYPTQQIAQPSPSSWGEEGYWKVWLNERNQEFYPHLQIAQERMTRLARQFPSAGSVLERALKQAARELMLAQASDWPFIVRANSSPEYARRRFQDHLLRFRNLCDQIEENRINESWLGQIEQQDNLFPDLDYRYWG